MRAAVGRVSELWRYPVKSLGGEPLTHLEIGPRGVAGDRWWAVYNAAGRIGSGKTTERFARVPHLLSLSSYTDDAGAVWVRTAGGERARVEEPAAAALVSRAAGEPVTLGPEGEVSHFDDMPVHIVTSASVRWLAAQRPSDDVCTRRLRPNLVIELEGGPTGGGTGTSSDLDRPLPEEAWCGRRMRAGSCVLRLDRPTLRCVMTTMSQPGLPFVPGLLRALEDLNGSRMGIYAEVTEPGGVHVGDEVWLMD